MISPPDVGGLSVALHRVLEAAPGLLVVPVVLGLEGPGHEDFQHFFDAEADIRLFLFEDDLPELHC